jgi:hypothetical protein
MRKFSSRIAVAAALSVLRLMPAHAAALVDQVTLVADSAVAGNPMPAPHTFTVMTAGSYTVTLTDLGVPAVLSSLQLDVASSTASAVAFSAAGSRTVTLQPGTYTAQALAVAASGSYGGSFSVQVVPQGGGTALLSFEDAVGLPPAATPTGQSTLQTQFTIAQAGSYQLTLTDDVFPAPLSSLQLIAIPNGVANPMPVFLLTAAGPATSAMLDAGTYDLIVVAQANSSTPAGLYSVLISGGPGNATALATTQPVGQLTAATTIAVPRAETVSLLVTDLATPKTLASLQGAVAQGATVLTQFTNPGPTTVTAAAGNAQLLIWAQPDVSAGQGSYGVYAYDSASTLVDVAEPVLDATHVGYAFSTRLASAGGYQLNLNDFSLPQAFGALSAVVAQKAAILTTAGGAAGSASAATLSAQAGTVNIVVFPVLAASGDNALFGVSLVTQPAGAIEFQATQGVGASFSSQTVQIPSVGPYVADLVDLGFPASLASLSLIVTSGQSVASEVTGAGKGAFTVTTPGTYVLNVLAQVGSAVNYGSYGLDLAAGVAPAVTLTSSASSVSSGQSVTLTWNATNASSCTASAAPSDSAWSGTLATSGSQSSGALTAATTFSLSCVGDGVTTTATASVSISASSGSHGGGGGLTISTLLALFGALMLRRGFNGWRYRE